MKNVDSIVQPEWGSPEWVTAYTDTYGMPPMAGGDDAAGDGDGGEASDGQGDSGLFDLTSVPEEYRTHVESVAKEIAANANKKFDEFAEFRKTMEPYQELGVTNYQPEQMEQLLAFAEIANDEDTFKEWWTNVGNEYGFMPEESSDEDDDWDDDDDDGEVNEDTVRSALNDLLEERLGPIQQREQERQEQELIAEANETIDSQLEAIRTEHGDFNEDAVLKLALGYAGDDDAIGKGFADYSEIISGAERNTLTSKTGSPRPPEGEGRAATGNTAPATFAEASAQAKERLRASH